MKRLRTTIVLGLLGLMGSQVFSAFEQEQMQIESQLQSRIESILSKTLPANSYLVTVKAEMAQRTRQTAQATAAKRGGGKGLLGQNQYVLPGVPGKKEFGLAAEPEPEPTVTSFSAETMVKKITITILVAPDVTAEQIRSLRDVITASVPFNPLRGDEMDIQNSPLLKPVNAPPASTPAATNRPSGATGNSSFLGSLSDKTNIPVLMLTGAIILICVLFMAFLLGPIRAFLNRLLAVLPRIGEQAAYTVSNAPSKTAATPTAANGFQYSPTNGARPGEDEGTRPFRFIREDQLPKLPILFQGLSPAQCALVLAYLPAEWASKVLATLDQGTQSAIMRELTQSREVPPDIVKELEEHIKSKIPYLVGGVDWIQSVYQFAQPQNQRAILGSLNQQSPELAQALRRKSFFMEDLATISSGALRTLIQEAGYPTAALAMRDEKPEVRTALLNRLPVALREILQQELDLSNDDKAAMMDAKVRLMNIGRRLLTEGKIALPETKAR